MSDDFLRPADAPASYYGPDGRPVFFQDPAMDRFVAVLINVASELWVQTERVAALSALLERAGIAGEEAERELAAAADAAREAELKAFLARVLEPLRERRD